MYIKAEEVAEEVAGVWGEGDLGHPILCCLAQKEPRFSETFAGV